MTTDTSTSHSTSHSTHVDAHELRYHVDGEVAVITLDNPARMNPMTHSLQLGLRELFARVAADTAVRALLITGSGRAFCAGADLSGVGGGTASGDTRSLGPRMADQMHALSNRVIQDLRALPLPVVSAVNGACAGAGVGIALAADITLAARSAYFYLPFMAKLGIVPDLGTTWFIQHRLGSARAAALTLLGNRLAAEQAAQWGLIWQCVDDAALADEALTLARQLATLPAHAALETRRALEAAALSTLDQQLAYEAERQRQLLDTPEFAEGVAAFLGKRPAVFPPR
jgi:2-(1,2-epoxy-1,2-dihydrophenyl)acetyl-CoA isomerase